MAAYKHNITETVVNRILLLLKDSNKESKSLDILPNII
jgi:hypothetical protein